MTIGIAEKAIEANKILKKRTQLFLRPFSDERVPANQRARIEKIQMSFAKTNIKFFNQQKREIMKWLRRGHKQLSIDPNDIDDILLLNEMKWKTAVRPYIERSTALSGANGAMLLGTTFDLRHPMAESWIVSRSATLVTNINTQTRKVLVDILHDGMSKRWALPDFEKAISTKFDSWTAKKWGIQSRSMLIARTETAYAYNGGSLLSYKQSGLVDRVRVLDNEMPKSCEICREANQKIWTLEESFNKPLAHPNCVRSFSPITTGEVVGEVPTMENLSLGGTENDMEAMRFAIDGAPGSSTMKSEVVDRLAMRTGLDKETVNRYIGNWAASSGDDYPSAIAMQMAAKDEFGLRSASLGHFMELRHRTAWLDALRTYEDHGMNMRLFLRGMYNETQERFALMGIKEVTLHRGVGFSEIPVGFPSVPGTVEKRIVSSQMQSMSSFSVTNEMAGKFAGVAQRRGQYAYVLDAKVPTSRIIGTARTGFGCLNEFEFVVLDSPGEVYATWLGL